MAPPFGAKQLRWMRTGAVRRLVATLQPAVVMERYYNFGGEGMMAAAAANARTVLEVNAPVIDHPGSAKARLDHVAHRRTDAPVARAHLRPRRPHRHAERGHPSAGHAGEKNRAPRVGRRYGPVPVRTHRARRRSSGRRQPSRSSPARSGAGTAPSTSCARSATLQARGRSDIGAVLVGDGPELPAVQDEAAGLANVVITGAVPHADMPACLAAADIGVAPFEIGAHRPLSLGFYWSPLKIFEYMAAGLPVVAPAVDRIPSLVADGREGALYDPTQARRPGARARDAGRPAAPPPARPRRPRTRRPRVQLEGPLPGTRPRDPGVRIEAKRRDSSTGDHGGQENFLENPNNCS